MKRLLSALSAVLIIVTFLSGCSDFEFNPVGIWRLTEESLYVDDQLIQNEKKGQDGQYKLDYCFNKSGTGYITVNGSKTLDFTYKYDGKSVTVYLNDPYSGIPPEENKSVFELADNGSLRRIRVQTQEVIDDKTKSPVNIELKEEFILTRQ